MNPWLETCGVVGLTLAGGAIGYGFSRLPKRRWLVGYIVPLVPVVLVAACQWIDVLNVIPPFSWLMLGRTEFVILAVAPTMLVMTLVPRLPGKSIRILLLAFLVPYVINYGIAPFLQPALVHGKLMTLRTVVDHRGICLQQTDYTCGPAAAVTALHQLGLHGEEGQIAILAHTCASAGTAPDSLMLALDTLYGRQGLRCEFRHFRSAAEMKTVCPVIAQIKYGFLVDHLVCVLAVTDKFVVVGDPLHGKAYMTHSEFEQKWRYLGIILRRENAHGPS